MLYQFSGEYVLSCGHPSREQDEKIHKEGNNYPQPAVVLAYACSHRFRWTPHACQRLSRTLKSFDIDMGHMSSMFYAFYHSLIQLVQFGWLHISDSSPSKLGPAFPSCAALRSCFCCGDVAFLSTSLGFLPISPVAPETNTGEASGKTHNL